MKRKVSLALCLALLGVAAVLPARAEVEKESSDPYAQLIAEGWQIVSPGVLQRDLGPGKLETLGFGAEGLRFRLKELRKHLAYLQAQLKRKPSQNLRKAIQAQRAQIARVLRALKTAPSYTELSATTEAASAGIDCVIKYGAHVNAFYLTNAQGVNATSDAYFNSNCGQIGEVYATSHGKARGTDGILYQQTKADPSTGIRSGVNVSANGSITPVNGVSECYSYAYASMTSYDIGVVYEQRVENTICPAAALALPAPTSSAGSSIAIYGYNCATVTWTANPSGGTTPYTYAWTQGTATTVLGTAKTYSRQFCGSNTTTTGSYTAKVTVTDSSAPTKQTKAASHTLTINYYYQSTDCVSSASTSGKATDSSIPPPCM
jgi:hypothetical protein